MSFTRDDERDYDRRQERIDKARDDRWQEVRDAIVKYEDSQDRRGYAELRSEIAKRDKRIAELEAEMESTSAALRLGPHRENDLHGWCAFLAQELDRVRGKGGAA